MYLTRDSRAAAGITSPPARLLLSEPARGLAELARLPLSAPWRSLAPRGDGHGVLVLPVLLATDTSTATVKVGDMPHWIATTSDGQTAYVTNELSNDVSVVDLATQTVTKKIKTTGGPWGVLVLAR